MYFLIFYIVDQYSSCTPRCIIECGKRIHMYVDAQSDNADKEKTVTAALYVCFMDTTITYMAFFVLLCDSFSS